MSELRRLRALEYDQRTLPAVTAIALLVHLAVAILLAFIIWDEARLIQELHDRGASRTTVAFYLDRLTDIEDRVESLQGWNLGLVAVTALCFLFWMYRAYTNAVVQTRGDGGRIASGAVGWWFVPLANLVMPYLYVADMWRAVGPDEDWRRNRVPTLAHLWWGAFVGGYLLQIILQVVVDGTNGVNLGLVVLAYAQLIPLAIFAGAAILAAVMVLRLTQAQAALAAGSPGRALA